MIFDIEGTFSNEDLQKIENKMQKIAKENLKGKEKDNVLKFLKSDDSGMIMIGASMMKGVLKE